MEDAIAALHHHSHKEYAARVDDLLRKKEEWVVLFRSGPSPRGHNTNNFAEATIRILKDIVLRRCRTYNAVSFIDLVASVWEPYLQKRLMRHACNRVPAHRLLFEKLLGSMPMDAADSIQEVGNDIYCVPSSDKSQVYEVWRDIGVCSCRCGRQGAYCKHQALVYSKFGGMFPNALH